MWLSMLDVITYAYEKPTDLPIDQKSDLEWRGKRERNIRMEKDGRKWKEYLSGR